MSSKRKYAAPSRSSYSRKSKRTRYTAMAQKANIPAVLRSRAGEIKLVDIPPNSVTFDSTGTFTLLNGIQEGAGQVNRIGRRIGMKSLRVTGLVRLLVNDATLNVGDYLRVMLIYDRQPNGSVPAVSDVLSSFDQTGANNNNTSYTFLNINNSDRFMILRDKRIAVPGFNATGNGGSLSSNPSLTGLNEPSFNIDMYCKLKGLETHYKSSSNPSVIGDISTGALYLFVYSIRATAASPFSFVFTSRLRFHDS